MATYDWVGTDSGNEGDFSVADNFSPSGNPDTGDTVRFRLGRQSVTGGKDQSAKNFAAIIVGPGYSGDIGSSAGAFQCGATLLSYNGRGNAWFDCSTGSFNYDEVYVMGGGTAKRVYFTGNIPAAHVAYGSATFESGTITELFVETMGSELSQPDVYLVDADVVALRVHSGTLRQNGSGTITTGYFLRGNTTLEEGTITNIECWGGTVTKNAPTTCASCKVFAGVVDASKDDRAKTFTSSEVHFAATLNIWNGPDNVTMTNPVKQVGGGKVIARTVSTVGI